MEHDTDSEAVSTAPRLFTTIRVSRAFGGKIQDLAQAAGLTVADVCDRELDEIVTAKLSVRLAARLREIDPAFANSLPEG